MKNTLRLAALALVMVSHLHPATALAEGTAFTYQGRLNDGTNPVNGLYDLRFAIYDAPDGSGTLLAAPFTNNATRVDHGWFTVTLDFGPGVFTGQARWLAIAVRTNGLNPFNALARQAVTAVPSAGFANSAGGILGDVPASSLSGTIPWMQLPTSLVTNGGSAVNLAGVFSGNGAGLTNLGSLVGLAGNQTFTGTNTFTQPLILSSSAPLIRLMGQQTTATLDLSSYDPGPNAPSASIQAKDNNGGSDVDFYTKRPGGNTTPLVSRLHLSANGYVGIGRANPRAPLEVTGTSVFDNNLTVRGTLAGNGSGLTNVPGILSSRVVTNTSLQAEPNTSYLLNNDQLSTLTLPASPAVGDVLQVAEAGAGAWRIVQNAGQSIRLGAAAAPDFGLTWISRASSHYWRALASSGDGALLAAADYGGYVWTSTDAGATWISQASRTTWSALAVSANGRRLVAGANPGFLWVSVDFGASWTSRAVNQAWYGVACSADGNKWVAAAYAGSLWTSTDAGATWTNRASVQHWQAVASSADGTKLLAAVNGGNLWTSTNSGVDWTSRATSQNWSAVACSEDGTKLIAAVGGGALWTSADSGVNWSSRTENRNWSAVAASADGSRLIAAVNGGSLWLSTDSGVTWASRADSRNWSAAALSADGSKLAAADFGGYVWTSAATPTMATTTTVGTGGYLAGDQDATIELLHVGDGLWKPLNHQGYISAH